MCRITLGLGAPCPEISDRVFRADAVVLGRTIKVERVQTRPEMFAVLYEFQIADVLKGDLYKPGETITYRFDPALHRGLDGMPLPSVDEGPHFAFVHRAANGEIGIGCPASLDEIGVPRMKRLIAVIADPLAHLDSESDDDVPVLLTCIMRRYCQFNQRSRGQSSTAVLESKARARVVAYLTERSAGCDKEISGWAVNLLAYLDPTPPEAFNVFVRALDSHDPGEFMAGAQGLENLQDPQAVPLLIDRLQRYRDDQQRTRDSNKPGPVQVMVARMLGRPGRYPDLRNPESELLRAVFSFDHPRATELAFQELNERSDWVAVDKVAEANHERALNFLLQKTWEGDATGLSALCKFSDPRIAAEARDRMYDHPHAPHILACRGDRGVREFMLRLIRQGNGTGATWAAQTRDPEAKADLIRGLSRAGGANGSIWFFRNEAAYALGRLRAFDLIPSLLGEVANLEGFATTAMLLMGLADRSIHEPGGCAPEEQWDCVGRSLGEVAEREGWTERDRKLADNLLETIKRGHDAIEYHDLYHPWSPPAQLSDMPDPLDKDASRRYLERNLEKVRKVLGSGAPIDQHKLMQAANNCKAAVLDGELAFHLLTGADRMVRSRAFEAVSADRPALTVGEIEHWALCGDGEGASMALNYIRRHPKPEYRAIVKQALYAGWHLFDEMLFEAIVETKAIEAADLLRAYLEHEHIALRVNAAVTLVHLGDSTGAAVLPDLVRKARGSGQLLRSQYVDEALKLSAGDPRRRNTGE